jgi:tetratricopeptide (TPR) repeat protein
VYQNILRRQRAVFHRQVAEALEGLYGESLEAYYEQLAYHYEQAGVEEKALAYLERAGDKAQAQYANAVAEGYYRALVDRLERLGRMLEAAGAREKLGAVLTTVGQYDAALVVLERVEEVYRASDDRERWAGTLAEIGHVYTLSQRGLEGLTRLQASLPDLEVSGPSHGLATLYAALAELFWEIGRSSEGLAAAERAATFARAVGDNRLLGRAEERRVALLLWMVGRHEDALQAAEEACRAAEAADDLETLGWALDDMAAIYRERGEFEAARWCLERALEVAERQGNPFQLNVMTVFLAQLSFFRGHWDQARIGLQRADSIRRQAGVDWPQNVVVRASLDLAEGAPDGAFQVLEDWVREFERSGEHFALPWAQRFLAERDLLDGHPEAAHARLVPLLDRPGLEESQVSRLLPELAWAHLEIGEIGEAEAVAAQAIRRMRADDDRLDLVDALRVQAMVAIRQGHWEEARSALEEGVDFARAMPYPYAEGRLLHVYGELHLRKGEPDQARGRLEEALAIFQRLGARKDAERVAQAMADLSPRA